MYLKSVQIFLEKTAKKVMYFRSQTRMLDIGDGRSSGQKP